VNGWASALATMMSHVNSLPPSVGNTVNPSSRLPSVRANPLGSLQTGMPADLIVLAKNVVNGVVMYKIAGCFLAYYTTLPVVSRPNPPVKTH